MQFLVDYLPLILFFVAFKWQGIYFATAVAIAASVVQILYLHFRRGRVGVVNWLSLAIIVIFGGATLLLQDEQFIKWKPTVLYGLFGTILAVGRIGFGRNLGLFGHRLGSRRFLGSGLFDHRLGSDSVGHLGLDGRLFDLLGFLLLLSHLALHFLC